MCLPVLATLGACATAPPRTASCEEQALLATQCIRVENLGEWEPVDDRRVLLWAAEESRAHLLRLSRPVAGLRGAEEIDVVDGDLDHLVCPCGHDAIGIEDRPESPARISSIEYLSEQRTAELIDAASSIL